MPLDIWNVGWLNGNSQRRYPLSDEASGRDVEGAIEIPDDFIVDLVITIPVLDSVDPGNFHLMSMAIFAQGVILTFGYNGTAMGVASVSSLTHDRNDSYAVVGQGDFFDAYGTVTIGQFDNLDLLPAGFYNFDLSGGRLVPTTVRPDIRGVSSIQVINGRDVSERLFGDITLISGRNVRLVADPAENQIRIDSLALSSDLSEACECDEQPGTPITSINGIGPDENGNFQVLGSACLEVVDLAADNSIELNDTCSQPCCGCDELNTIREDLKILQSDANTVKGQAQRIEAVVQQLSASIFSSKTGSGDPCP